MYVCVHARACVHLCVCVCVRVRARTCGATTHKSGQVSSFVLTYVSLYVGLSGVESCPLCALRLVCVFPMCLI